MTISVTHLFSLALLMVSAYLEPARAVLAREKQRLFSPVSAAIHSRVQAADHTPVSTELEFQNRAEAYPRTW